MRTLLAQWIQELKEPRIMKDGQEVLVYPENEIPPFLSVADVGSIPVDQLRAELVVAAAKLESLAST